MLDLSESKPGIERRSLQKLSKYLLNLLGKNIGRIKGTFNKEQFFIDGYTSNDALVEAERIIGYRELVKSQEYLFKSAEIITQVASAIEFVNTHLNWEKTDFVDDTTFNNRSYLEYIAAREIIIREKATLLTIIINYNNSVRSISGFIAGLLKRRYIDSCYNKIYLLNTIEDNTTEAIEQYKVNFPIVTCDEDGYEEVHYSTIALTDNDIYLREEVTEHLKAMALKLVTIVNNKTDLCNIDSFYSMSISFYRSFFKSL